MAGDFDLDDVFCASWTVVIVTAVSFVFLQCCILVVCVLCIYAGRKSAKNHDAQRQHQPGSVLLGSSSAASTAPSAFNSQRHMDALTPPPFGSSASLYGHGPLGSSAGGTSTFVAQGPVSAPGVRSRSGYHEHSASTLKSLRTSLRD